VQASDAINNPVKLSHGRATLDVTAVGNDILKRVQGSMSLTQNYKWPGYTLQSMDTICKRLRLNKTDVNTYTYNGIDDGNATGQGDDAACQPSS
jgi:hypothetical protein